MKKEIKNRILLMKSSVYTNRQNLALPIYNTNNLKTI